MKLDKMHYIIHADIAPLIKKNRGMDNSEKFNKTSLPEKDSFYSNLNMENITASF